MIERDDSVKAASAPMMESEGSTVPHTESQHAKNSGEGAAPQNMMENQGEENSAKYVTAHTECQDAENFGAAYTKSHCAENSRVAAAEHLESKHGTYMAL